MSRAAYTPRKAIDAPDLPKAAVRRLLDQAGGIKRAAARLGYRSDSQVYAFADPNDPAEITFAQVAAVSGRDAPAGAEYLAQLCGGVFLPLPAPDSPIAALTAEAMREAGQAAADLVEALGGGLTAEEAARVLPELDDAIRSFSQLRAKVAARARRESD